jgi:thioredoxin-related protein
LHALVDLLMVADTFTRAPWCDCSVTFQTRNRHGHHAPEVDAALRSFTVVRIDALSDAAVTGPDGAKTSGRRLSARLGVTHRPTLILLDGPAGDKKEIARIENMLYRYHFTGVLEYVGEG